MAALAGHILAPDLARAQRRRISIGIQREIAFVESVGAICARRDAWKAAVLRTAYSTGWLPPEVVRNIRHVEAAPDGSRVDLWLWTGTQITDTCDRIAVSGLASAIAVEEIVAVVQRRGWTAVAVTGPNEFKHAVTAWLALARPPVEVVNYTPSRDEIGLPEAPEPPASTGRIVTRHISPERGAQVGPPRRL